MPWQGRGSEVAGKIKGQDFGWRRGEEQANHKPYRLRPVSSARSIVSGWNQLQELYGSVSPGLGRRVWREWVLCGVGNRNAGA